MNANYAKAYPPDGQKQEWWSRLKAAMGTSSSDYVNATLLQVQSASRLPGGGISETGINAVLAFIEGAQPRNEVEAALAIQMGCLHAAIMSLMSAIGSGGGFGFSRQRQVTAVTLTRLMKSFAEMTQTFDRLKSGASQNIRVEHVHVHEGAQAIVGNVKRKE